MKITTIAILILLFSLFTFLTWNFFGVLIIFCIWIFLYLIQKNQISNVFRSFFLFYCFFFCYNLFSTFWLYHSEPFYSILIFIINAFLQTLIFFFLYKLSKFYKNYSFFLLWVAFEILLTKWDLAWPWLILGNSLANSWYIIQWYSYVGVYGGSIWIIFFSWYSFKYFFEGKFSMILILLILPCFISVCQYTSNLNSIDFKINNQQKIVIFNPSELNTKEPREIKDLVLYFTENTKDSLLIISPELYYTLDYPMLNDAEFQSYLNYYFERNSNSTLLLGVELINKKDKFNSIFLYNDKQYLFRTKKKYVPVTEFTHNLLTPFFGETHYSKNKDDDTKKLKIYLKTMPFVCYEILFSDFVARNVFDSNYLILMSSEDFMNGSKYGKRQYDNLVRLRAIENGRFLIKNSYNGTSSLYSPNGDIVEIFDKTYNIVNIPEINENTVYQKFIYHLHNLF